MDSQYPGTRPHDSILLKIINWHTLFDSDTPPRLGIEVRKRLPYTTFAAFTTGMAIGSSHGSKKAAYQFRAENAHRFPTTTPGWFQYHKSKNYITIVGGVKEGVRMGLKLGAGAFTFCLFEETVDYARHDRRDFLSTVTAGLSFSGIYSLLARHDVFTAARTTKLGLKLSLAYGLTQDALESLKAKASYHDTISPLVLTGIGKDANNKAIDHLLAGIENASSFREYPPPLHFQLLSSCIRLRCFHWPYNVPTYARSAAPIFLKVIQNNEEGSYNNGFGMHDNKTGAVWMVSLGGRLWDIYST